MRRAIGRAWPALSYHFGIYPRDVYWITYSELGFYLDALDDILAELSNNQPTGTKPLALNPDGTIPVIRPG